MTGRPLQVTVQAQFIRTLRGLGLDVSYTAARNAMVAGGVSALLVLALAAEVVTVLIGDEPRRSPITVGGEPVQVAAAVLAACWLLQCVTERARASKWSGRPSGRWESTVRYPQSAMGCDVYSVFLVEVVGAAVLRLAPLVVVGAVALGNWRHRSDGWLLVAVTGAGLLILLDAWFRTLRRMTGTDRPRPVMPRRGLSSLGAAAAGLVLGRLVGADWRPTMALELPPTALLTLTVVLYAGAAVQAGRLIRAAVGARDLPLHRPVVAGARTSSTSSSLDGFAGRRITGLARLSLPASVATSRVLVFTTSFVVAAPALFGGLRTAPAYPLVAGFLALTYLATVSCAMLRADNLVTAGRAHRALYELGYPRRFGYLLSGAREALRLVLPGGALTLIWLTVWPDRWYEPLILGSAVIAGCLLADAVVGSTSSRTATELQRMVFAAVILAVAFVVWQVSRQVGPLALTGVAVVVLVGGELWAYKIQRLRLS